MNCLNWTCPVSLQAMGSKVKTPCHLVGGHSLAGQLACCLAALSSVPLDGLWLVSGPPDGRHFPRPRRWLLPPAYRFMQWLAQRNGALPGRRIGFGGNQARGLIRDWSGVGLNGRYAGQGLQVDLQEVLASMSLPVTSVLLAQHWLAPATSLAGLTCKFAAAPSPPVLLEAAALGTRADHFAWMRHPQHVAQMLAWSMR